MAIRLLPSVGHQCYAPEMVPGDPYTRAIDWWSLGVLIYEMLVGVPPFTDPDEGALYQSIMKDEFIYPADLSTGSVSIMTKLLLKDPKQRLGLVEADAEAVKTMNFSAGSNGNGSIV